MHPKHFIFLTFLLTCILAQLRPCLYSSSSSSSSYTYLNSQHQLQYNSTCILCLPQCKSCLSADDITCAGGNCQSKYYYDTVLTICKRCMNLCMECSDGSTCASCISGYYLTTYSNNSSICKPCPNGAQSCTSSSIITCSDGYYYDPQTYICRQCTPQNCIQCSSKSSCNICASGYTLSSDGTTCQSCNITNCAKCIAVNTCMQCAIGYQLQGNNYCGKMNCTAISQCIQCSNHSNGVITCTKCGAGFYLLDNMCNYGASILCEYSLTPKYINSQQWTTNPSSLSLSLVTDSGSCQTCSSLSNLAQNTATICIPSERGSSNLFYTDYISYTNYTLCAMPYMTVSQPGSTFQFKYALVPAYQVRIVIVAVISDVNVNLSNINASSLVNVQVNVNNTLGVFQVDAYPLHCSSPALAPSIILKLTISYKILTDYQSNSSSSSSSLNSSTASYNLSQIQPLSMIISPSIPNSAQSQISIKQSYIKLLLCIVDNCLQCLSSSSCTKCLYPYMVQNFKCVLQCDIGYYVNKITGKCVLQCEPGFYYDIPASITDNICTKCPSQCTLCSNSTSCSQCSTGYFLTIDGNCRNNCDIAGVQLTMYYPNIQMKMCKLCINPCKTCSITGTNCTSCLIGFQYYAHTLNNTVGTCVLQCPIGFYSKVILSSSSSQPNPKCLPCSPSCLACSIQNTTCTKCQIGYFLYMSTCWSSCPDGFYGDNSLVQYNKSARCSPCFNPCASCDSRGDNCTKCKFGLNLLPATNITIGQCVSACPTLLYYTNTSSHICTKCSYINCLQCTLTVSINFNFLSQQLCLMCNNSTVLQSNRCVINCSNSWSIQGICQSCPYPCGTCLGYSSNNFTCFSCTDNYFVYNGTCVRVCPQGYYGNTTSYMCIGCVSQCTTCSYVTSNGLSSVQCLSCATDYILSNYTCITQSIGCPSGSYLPISPLSFAAFTNFTCYPCSSECLTCSDRYNMCTGCSSGKYLLAYSGQCLLLCPHQYFPSNINSSCTKCSSQCNSCQYSSNNCTSCSPSLYLYYNTSISISSCLSIQQCNSIPTLYADRHTSLCTKCIAPCLDCTAETVCLSCTNGTYLYGNYCVSTCSNGYYGNSSGVCYLCNDACTSCSSQTLCQTCKPNYYYRQSSAQCLKVCPSGQFGNVGSMMCQTCRFPCLQCTNNEYCLSCQNTTTNGISSPLILLNGQCLSSCPTNYYPLSTPPFCLPCPISCTTCTSPSICLTCSFNYYLSNNECVNSTSCAVLYYADTNTRTCAKCQPPCLSCISKYQCSSCVSGHMLRDSACYINCPIGTYSSNYTCITCPINCTRCKSATQCLDCTTNTYLYSPTSSISVCVSICPDGSYLDLPSSQCPLCISNCLTCTQRANKCLSCTPLLTLQNYVCVSNCTNYYYQVTHQQDGGRYCQMCNSSCVKCVSADLCLQCNSAYLVLLYDQSVTINAAQYSKSYCALDCPAVTFKNTQNFTCQPCPIGCLQCTSSQTCLSCSSSLGYILYNIKCVSSCPSSSLYTIPQQNRCVQLSYCQSLPQIYYIYKKQQMCYRKDNTDHGCPNYLVYVSDQQCADQCTNGMAVNFNRYCVKSNINNGAKFAVRAIASNQGIDLIVSIDNNNVKMQSNWANLFSDVTVTKGIQWTSSASSISKSRLLQQQISFTVVPKQPQPDSNILILNLVPVSPILSPLDLTITTRMLVPYSLQISLYNLPLQNYMSTTTLRSFLAPQLQNNVSNRVHALAVLFIIAAVAVSVLNLWRSGKIYLLVPMWDIMHLLYLLGFTQVYWSNQIAGFFNTFGVTWFRLFTINLGNAIIGTDKLYATVGSIQLIGNIVCNIIFIGLAAIAYLISVIVHHVNQPSNINNKDGNNGINKPNLLTNLQKILHESTSKSLHARNLCHKILLGICYLSVPNIVFFSFLNLFYWQHIVTFQFILSIFVIIATITIFGYVGHRQIMEKKWLDSGIHQQKKTIIICLPMYLMFRKLMLILFMALYADNKVFAICFGLVSTTFIFILVIWFQPYKNQLRYRFSLAHQCSIFILFLFLFIYACNQRQILVSAAGEPDGVGYLRFIIFLGTLACVTAMLYPVHHLYVLMNGKKYTDKVIDSLYAIYRRNHQKNQGRMGRIQKKVNFGESEDESQNQGNQGYCVQDYQQNTFITPKPQDQQSDKQNQQQGQKRVHNDRCQNVMSKAPQCYRPPELSKNIEFSSQTYSLVRDLGNLQLQSKIQKSKISSIMMGVNQKQDKSAIRKQLNIPRDSIIQGQTDHQADESSQQGQHTKMKLADYTVRLTKKGAPVVKQFKNYDLDSLQGEQDQDQLAEKQIKLSKLIEKQRTLIKARKESNQLQIESNLN